MQDQKRHLETADKPSNRSADDSGGIRDSLYLSMQQGCNFYFLMLVFLNISQTKIRFFFYFLPFFPFFLKVNSTLRIDPHFPQDSRACFARFIILRKNETTCNLCSLKKKWIHNCYLHPTWLDYLPFSIIIRERTTHQTSKYR